LNCERLVKRAYEEFVRRPNLVTVRGGHAVRPCMDFVVIGSNVDDDDALGLEVIIESLRAVLATDATGFHTAEG